MSITADLFPETLLVERNGTQIYTTSRTVAHYFEKRHDNVRRAIEQLIADLDDPVFSSLNFEERIYQYTTAKKQTRTATEYHLSEEGFALVAMRFTGKKALHWQKSFLKAFMAMRAELHARTARYAAALDAVRPSLRPVTEATERGYSRTEIGLLLDKSPASISYHRRSARRLGLLTA